MGQSASTSSGPTSDDIEEQPMIERQIVGEPERTELFVEGAGRGDVAQVEEYLQFLNAKNTAGDTALLAAVHGQQEEVVALLLRQGSALEVNCKDQQGATPLLMAASTGNLSIVRMLLDFDACKRLVTDENGWSCIHHACSNGHLHIVETLHHELGSAPFDQHDSHGCTPLYLASHEGFSGVAKFLLSVGVALDAKDCEGRTALDVADNDTVRGYIEQEISKRTPPDQLA